MGLILLVEDEKVAQLFTKRTLMGLSHEVDTAETGQEAVEKASNKYCLIIMDIGLPDYGSEGGVRATEEIRAKGVTVPIIAVSANELSELKDKLDKAGVVGYLKKPFQKELFQELFDKLVKK